MCGLIDQNAEEGLTMTRLELIRKLHRKRKSRTELPKVDPEAERELRAEEPEREPEAPAVVDRMEGCAL